MRFSAHDNGYVFLSAHIRKRVFLYLNEACRYHTPRNTLQDELMSESRKSGYHILVVDDDPEWHEILALLFSRRGWKTER